MFLETPGEIMKHQATKELKQFFINLLELKKEVLQKYEKTGNEDLKEIYERLHTIIKSTNEVS